MLMVRYIWIAHAVMIKGSLPIGSHNSIEKCMIIFILDTFRDIYGQLQSSNKSQSFFPPISYIIICIPPSFHEIARAILIYWSLAGINPIRTSLWIMLSLIIPNEMIFFLRSILFWMMLLKKSTVKHFGKDEMNEEKIKLWWSDRIEFDSNPHFCATNSNWNPCLSKIASILAINDSNAHVRPIKSN